MEKFNETKMKMKISKISLQWALYRTRPVVLNIYS